MKTLTSSRRNFLKSLGIVGSSILVSTKTVIANQDKFEEGDGDIIRLKNENISYLQPLEELTVTSSKPGKIIVLDGKGDNYFESEIKEHLTFQIGGSLGNQIILYFDENELLFDIAAFKVDCKTEIIENTGIYENLLKNLYWTMVKNWGATEIFRLNDNFYECFVRWLRDHVHTLKGMKYFYPELKSGIDLYADTQREDGMIWDNIYPRKKVKNWWDKRFSYGDFIREIENGNFELKRIPVENDVEYLFIEGLYFTWKATGDTPWMAEHLDKCIKAIDYSLSDPYRWSEKYNLLKRGFTIDTWDFQSNEDTEISGGDIMVVKLGKTRFGIMFGDNTGMSQSCKFLAEMLSHVGRNEESKKYSSLAKTLQSKIDDLSWNGDFYKHHVPEDENIKRDLGVDQNSQVSLSNAYSINRNISDEKAKAIIKTYIKIKDEMPETSTGEWYTIYPPFKKGFGANDSSSLWEYMNGGVTSIVAGELAHGAFEHGYERYGVDILNRLYTLTQQNDNYLDCVYRGKMPDKPKQNFTTIDLSDHFSIDYPTNKAQFNDKPLNFQAVNNIKHFFDIPFLLNKKSKNQFSCINLKGENNTIQSKTISINAKFASLHLLHTVSPNHSLAGTLTINYSDGSSYTDYITNNKIGHWWTIENKTFEDDPSTRLAWRSNNEDFFIAFYVYGLNNPKPNLKVNSLTFESTHHDAEWFVKALTLSDQEVFFMPSKISHGIPDNWGAAAVVYAMIEGLAGVKDESLEFKKITLSPRWLASNTKNAKISIKYPASNGYVYYYFNHNEETKQINLKFTSEAQSSKVSVLLADNIIPKKAMINNTIQEYELKTTENSTYIQFLITKKGIYNIDIFY